MERNDLPPRAFSLLDTMASLDDLASVIKRAQELDHSAFEELVDRYSSRLYGFLYRLTGCREDAEDLVQEVFVRVVRMIVKYEDDGRFDAWLFRIATNLVRDRIRRSKRRPAPASLDPEEHAAGSQPGGSRANIDAPHPSPSRTIELTEDADRLQTAITRLPDAEREVVLLRHYARMTFSQIADAMGTPMGTALARAHRGLAKLRTWMEPPS